MFVKDNKFQMIFFFFFLIIDGNRGWFIKWNILELCNLYESKYELALICFIKQDFDNGFDRLHGNGKLSIIENLSKFDVNIIVSDIDVFIYTDEQTNRRSVECLAYWCLLIIYVLYRVADVYIYLLLMHTYSMGSVFLC